MWPIVRDAFAEASPAIRSQFRWIVVFWLLVVAAQAWDSRDGRGPAGVAEFLSAILGASGVALLGLAHTLQRTMHEVTLRRQPTGEAAAGIRRRSRDWARRWVTSRRGPRVCSFVMDRRTG